MLQMILQSLRDYPEPFHITRSEGSATTPSIDDQKATVQRSTDQGDVPTTLFVNFLPSLHGTAKDELTRLTRLWSHGKLGGIGHERISVDKAGFHTAILKAILQGSKLPDSVFPHLDIILHKICYGLRSSN